MREINTREITQAVCELLIDANYNLPKDVYKLIDTAINDETNERAKNILCKLCENAVVAKDNNVPICQDTGMAILFFEIGQDVVLIGEYFEDAVNEGVRRAYNEGYLRKSVVKDPFFERVNTNDNTPAIIHTRIVKGDKIKITAAPKGFGSENMSAMKMFTPSASKDEIECFIVETVKNAGGNPCPPIIVGVGLGGDFEYCAYLAKKALTEDLSIPNENKNYDIMQREILEKINNTDIGPCGFGGRTTALAVKILSAPTHIAGLPCAVNIGCHVTRHIKKIL